MITVAVWNIHYLLIDNEGFALARNLIHCFLVPKITGCNSKILITLLVAVLEYRLFILAWYGELPEQCTTSDEAYFE